MPAITITDLNNAKSDVDHIAAFATGATATATDRMGQTKPTIKGASDSITAKVAAVEAAKATAINTTIAGLVAAATTAINNAKDAAVVTTIPVLVSTATSAINSAKDTAVNFTIPASVSSAVLTVNASRDTAINQINAKVDATDDALATAINSLKAYNPRGLFSSGIIYSAKDLYIDSGIVYITILDHTSTSIPADVAAGKVTIHKGITSLDLAARELQKKTVNLLDYDNLRDAINALPADGGIVDVPIGRFFAGEWNYNTQFMSKNNVTIRGAKMPMFSSNCDRLEGGSVIEGRFNVFAHNFHHENIGYDVGKYVCDTRFPSFDSHSANYPLLGGTWDAFAFAQPNMEAPAPARKNYSARNVVGLLRDSQSYGHAILQECFDGGTVENVIGMYGIHGLVIKASNVSCGFIAGYGASGDHVILKSDSYAAGFNIKIDTVETGKAPPGATPWSTPAYCTYGLFINPATADMSGIKISKARLYGAQCLLGAAGPTVKYLDNLMINDLEIDGFGLASPIGINFSSLNFNRISFGAVTITNVADGIAYANNLGAWGTEPMTIQSLKFTSVSLRCLQALGYGSFYIDQLRTIGTINTIYSIADTGRVYVGLESFQNAPTVKFGNGSPTLSASWEQYPGNSGFRVNLENYGVQLTGLLRPVAGGSGIICSLPAYLRPADSKRLPAISAGVSNAISMRLVEPGANLLVNGGVNATGAEMWLSLDSVFWKLN